MNDPRREEETLFEAARKLADPGRRAAFLDAACAGNPQLRRQIDELFAAQGAADQFFDPGVLKVRALGGSSGHSNDPARTTGCPESPEAACATVLDPLAECPGSVSGRYKLLEKLGEGGFGSVWAAEQREPVRRRVALKIIKLGMDTKQVVARFEAERQALALMDHPNIAKVLDAGTTESGRPYFVMELVKGIRITEYCEREKLETEARLDLFIKVCHAIQHAHQKGIIHRDIKPSNILVTLHDGVPVPKVIDFGIAKATQGELTDKTVYTQFQQFIGTPAYMSPEQAEMSGLDIDTRSDIYSLGVLLYELLTGATPFDTKDLMRSGLDEMRKIIREREPVRPSTRIRQTASADPSPRSPLAPRLSPLASDLDWIVMKCLEKDRARRYETANALAADLRRHLNHEPIVARPPSTAYKLQKAWRRNKLVFSAAAAVAAALVIGLGVSTWQAVRAIRAEQEQSKLREVAVQALDGEKRQRNQAEEQRQRADTQARKATESQQQSRRLLYASDMNLAQQSLKLNNLGRARRLLDRHRPQPGEEDLRGWEWRYLWQLTRSSALVTLTNRTVRGFDVSLSPDGNRLAVGWFDGSVDLWDVPARRWVRALTDREFAHQGRVAFSPVRNLLAATSEPGVVALYDLDSGRESVLWRAPEEGAWDVRNLAFSPDGSRLVIYAGSSPELGDAVWVVNVSSSKIESRHSTLFSESPQRGAARLSPDNRRLYLARSDRWNGRYSIQCLDLVTGRELWQTERVRDHGVTALALSPDGRVLASGSGLEDSAIRIWDAATGRFLRPLEGHSAYVTKLVFSKDGRQLISCATDQTIRFWDTSTWTETKVLRGHTDEVRAVTVSESAQLVASTGKDGNLMLWKDDGKSATEDGHLRLREDLDRYAVLPLDHSRLLLLSPGGSPEWIDLKRDTPPVSLPELGSSTNVLGWFGANILCRWNGTNHIRVHELCGEEFIQRGAIALDSGTRPTGFAYNPTRQLLAWTEGTSSNSVYLESLAAPGRRIELRSDVPGLVPFRFSEDGNYLAAAKGRDSLRVWNVETGQIVAFIGGHGHATFAAFRPPGGEVLLQWFIGGHEHATFAAGGRVLVVAINQNDNHEIAFHDLTRPGQPPRRVPGRYVSWSLAVSPDGGLVASSTTGGQVRLYDAATGEWIADLHGHLNAAFGVAFSPDGRRLISTFGAREAVKLWDVRTRQELLTLSGTGSFLQAARWSADGDVILAGPPWQAWRAPSWAEIDAAESKEGLETGRP